MSDQSIELICVPISCLYFVAGKWHTKYLERPDFTPS